MGRLSKFPRAQAFVQGLSDEALARTHPADVFQGASPEVTIKEARRVLAWERSKRKRRPSKVPPHNKSSIPYRQHPARNLHRRDHFGDDFRYLPVAGARCPQCHGPVEGFWFNAAYLCRACETRWSRASVAPKPAEGVPN
jgi:hypothetical protein